jgi:transposase-like protein
MMEQFGAFTASELYCPKCKVAQPVREKLLLVLPTGELHQYLCSKCGSSLGERTTTAAKPVPLVLPHLAAHPKRRLLR